MNYNMEDPPQPLGDRLEWYSKRLEEVRNTSQDNMVEFQTISALFIAQHARRLAKTLREANRETSA
jgi:hypothetical protein